MARKSRLEKSRWEGGEGFEAKYATVSGRAAPDLTSRTHLMRYLKIISLLMILVSTSHQQQNKISCLQLRINSKIKFLACNFAKESRNNPFNQFDAAKMQ